MLNETGALHFATVLAALLLTWYVYKAVSWLDARRRRDGSGQPGGVFHDL